MVRAVILLFAGMISLNQDIFKDTKNNEIQIHYLRHLVFEKCITYVQVGLYQGLNNGQPTSQTIHPYVDQSMTTIAYCRPLGAQRVMLWFFDNFKCQLS